jgi:hypothetical protein
MQLSLYARPMTFGFQGFHNVGLNDAQLAALPENYNAWTSAIITGGLADSYVIGFGQLWMNGGQNSTGDYGLGGCGDVRTSTSDLMTFFDNMTIGTNQCYVTDAVDGWSIDPNANSWGQFYARFGGASSAYTTSDIESRGLSAAVATEFFSSYDLLVLCFAQNTSLSQTLVDAVTAYIKTGKQVIFLLASAVPADNILVNIGLRIVSPQSATCTHLSSDGLSRYKAVLGDLAVLAMSSLGAYTSELGGVGYRMAYSQDPIWIEVATPVSAVTLQRYTGSWYSIYDTKPTVEYDPNLHTSAFSRYNCCWDDDEVFVQTVTVPSEIIKPDSWDSDLRSGYLKITWGTSGDLAGLRYGVQLQGDIGPDHAHFKVAGIDYNFDTVTNEVCWLLFDQQAVLKAKGSGSPEAFAGVVTTSLATDLIVVYLSPLTTSQNLNSTTLMSALVAIGCTHYYITHNNNHPYTAFGGLGYGRDNAYQYCSLGVGDLTSDNYTVAGEVRANWFSPSEYEMQFNLTGTTYYGANAIIQFTKKLARQDNNRTYPVNLCATIQDVRFQKLLQYSINSDCGISQVQLPCMNQWDYPDISVNDVQIMETDGAPVCTSLDFNKIVDCHLVQDGSQLRIAPSPRSNAWKGGDSIGAISANYGAWFAWPNSISNWLTGDNRTGHVVYKFHVYLSGYYTIVTSADDHAYFNIDNGYFAFTTAGWQGNETRSVYLSSGDHTITAEGSNDSGGGSTDWNQNPAVFAFCIHQTFQGALGGYYIGNSVTNTSRQFLAGAGITSVISIDDKFKAVTTNCSMYATDSYKGYNVANMICYYGGAIGYDTSIVGTDQTKFYVKGYIEIPAAGCYCIQFAAGGIGGMRVDGGPWQNAESSMIYAYNQLITDLGQGFRLLEFWIERDPVQVNGGRQEIPFGYIVYPYVRGDTMYDAYARFDVHLSSPVTHRDPIYVDYMTSDYSAGVNSATGTENWVDDGVSGSPLNAYLFSTQYGTQVLGWSLTNSSTFPNGTSTFLNHASVSSDAATTTPIWMTNVQSGATYGDGHLSISYKFYTNGGKYILNQGGSNHVDIRICKSDSNGTDLGYGNTFIQPSWTPAIKDSNGDIQTPSTQTGYNTSPYESVGVELTLDQGWYRVEAAARDYNVFSDIPNYENLLVLSSYGLSASNIDRAHVINFKGTTYWGARSYNILTLDSNGNMLDYRSFDVHGGNVGNLAGGAAATAYINSLSPDVIICVVTYDEPTYNLVPSGLYAALLGIGASTTALDALFYRSAYVLVGKHGLAQGQGIEKHAGVVDSDPNSYARLYLNLSDFSSGLPALVTPDPTQETSYITGWVGCNLQYTAGSILSLNSGGADYISQRGTLQFNKGDQDINVPILILGDNIPESLEKFKLLLTDASRGQIVDGEGVGTIVDDEAPIFSTYQWEKLLGWSITPGFNGWVPGSNVFLTKVGGRGQDDGTTPSWYCPIWISPNSGGTGVPIDQGGGMWLYTQWKMNIPVDGNYSFYGGCDDDMYININKYNSDGSIGAPYINQIHCPYSFNGSLYGSNNTFFSAGDYYITINIWNQVMKHNEWGPNAGYGGIVLLHEGQSLASVGVS